MSNWVDAEDELPEKKPNESSVMVLCWIALDSFVSGFYSFQDKKWYDFMGDVIETVYFWRDLPEDPLGRKK